MLIIWAIVATIVGALMPVQAVINTELTNRLNHPFLGALCNFMVGAFVLLLISLTQPLPWGELKRIGSFPPHLFLGGVLGATFVGSSIFFIPRIGATAMIASFVSGQLLMSVLLDKTGWLGLEPIPIAPSRIFGLLLLFAGLALVLKK